jgi:hypothetical protein
MNIAEMITEVLYRSGRSMTFRELHAAIREMWAVKVSRRQLRLGCYAVAHLKRSGSTLYVLDRDLRADYLWREIEAVPSN